MSQAETGTRLAFRADDYARIAESLRSTDDLLSTGYPGDDGSRQPVHTVYVPADTFTPDLVAEWGQQALAAVAAVAGEGGLEQLAEHLGLATPSTLAALVAAKLSAEPIEDLRLDFEDGYGARPDAEEDAHAIAAGRDVAQAVTAGTAPPFIGIRFKSLEAATRERGLRTLDLFLSSLLSGLAADGSAGSASDAADYMAGGAASYTAGSSASANDAAGGAAVDAAGFADSDAAGDAADRKSVV